MANTGGEDVKTADSEDTTAKGSIGKATAETVGRMVDPDPRFAAFDDHDLFRELASRGWDMTMKAPSQKTIDNRLREMVADGGDLTQLFQHHPRARKFLKPDQCHFCGSVARCDHTPGPR